MATFTSRTRSKIAASACAVFRSSQSPASNSSLARCARAAIAAFCPDKNFSVFSRSAKFRNRSTDVAACCKPSNVKLSCRRYGTDASRKRTDDGLVPLARRSRSVKKLPRDFDIFSPSTSKCSRSEEHTSELQSQSNLVCRLLLEKKKKPHTHNRLCANSN